MRRGTRVGQAYVAVTADGSGINEEIVDSVDAAGNDIDKSGDEQGRSYGEHFSEGFKERLGSIRSRLGSVLSDRLREAGTEAGTEAGDAAGESLGSRMVAKTRDLGDRISETLGDRLASKSESVRRGLGKFFDDDTADGLAIRFADRLTETLGDRIELALGNEGQNLSDLLDELVSRNSGSGGSGGSREEADFASRVGKMFGAGSRNNFLNLFGKSLGGVLRLSQKVTDVASGIGSTFMKGFSEAGEGASFLQKIMGGLSKTGAGAAGSISKAFSALAASAPALAIGIVVVVGALSAMVSVVGALLGLATALAATITSALVGGVLVLGGALGAAAVAGGLLAVAFTSMTEKQSEFLKSSFQPLKAELTGIGQLIIGEMVPYFKVWSDNLQQALLLVAPLASVMGEAFAGAGAALTAALSGPGFQILTQQLGIYLPNIVGRLSAALGSFLNGVAGTFAALLPSVDRFAGYLARVAERFATFATSASGQNAIVDFVNRAVDSLRSLWNFVRELGGLIFDVLFSPAAQNAGNGLFDGLARTLRRARDSINEADLEKWFNDAINFGSDLWKVMGALKDTFVALYDAGVLEAVGDGFSMLADFINSANVFLDPFVQLMGVLLPIATSVATPLGQVAFAIDAIAGSADNAFGILFPLVGLLDKLGVSPSGGGTGLIDQFNATVNSALYGPASGNNSLFGFPLPPVPEREPFDLQSLLDLGNNALDNTLVSNGGYKPDPVKPTKPEYVNPYEDYANSLIASMPGIKAAIRKAMRDMNKAIKDTLAEAVAAIGGSEAQSLVTSQVEGLQSAGVSLADQARSALESAAQSLANASNKKDAKKALAEVAVAQDNLRAALAKQADLEQAAGILGRQKILSAANVSALLSGIRVYNATLADYAEARAQIATMLEKANQDLIDAIALRDNYAKQVADGVKSFGNLLTASAKTLNGITQALTAGDITSNLQDRLEKIKAFKSGLEVLLAQGLSQEAYKQLLDAGVEQGGAYVQALLNGGVGAVQETNGLIAQIGAVADDLGLAAGNQMYQAGVNAAQGLVDGLTSLSAQLNSAAAQLGAEIAASIARSLGIASPSKVGYSLMYDDLGDGMRNGLLAARGKVTPAAKNLSDSVAISPSLAMAMSEGRVPAGAPVSGNPEEAGRYFRDLIVQTPSEDPEAVATETVNEIVGRLPG